MGYVQIGFFLLITFACGASSTSLFAKIFGLHTSSKRMQISPPSKLSLLVEIPGSTVHYAKPFDVTGGGKFLLETPMEKHAYSSAGRSYLHRVSIAYLMQSMYRPNHLCFFLHFWSMKDPQEPWNMPHFRISPPYWSRYNFQHMF